MRKKGQHFLVDCAVSERIASYAQLKQGDRVLEIGPGTGNLTGILAAHVTRVYAVEVDPNLAAELCGRFPNVVVINADASPLSFPATTKSSPTCPTRSPPG